VTFRQEPNRIFDFMSLTPESMHMLTWLFSPRGIPKDFRHMDGFGVNTYRMVNAAGDGVLVKYHWKTQQGIESLTQAQADVIQATDLGSASRDIFEAIERGEHPRWELSVQIMSDDEHPELDFDPLDDTKTWPEDVFPLRPVGMMTLDRNVDNFFAENEQSAFGTGVLVDGLDFSDDKMLTGRTFSYSDTQRYRVGPNYLQLPINQPIHMPNTNQRDGQMAYRVDGTGRNVHVNYEPNSTGGLREADAAGPAYEPEIHGRLTRSKIERTNDFGQAGERYRTMPDWERDDLVANMTDLLARCDPQIQERMVGLFTRCDPDYGTRVAGGLGISSPSVAAAR
jgi:catalase